MSTPEHQATPAPLPPHLGLEARVTDDDHQSLKLWLRMMACTNQVQAELRRRLRLQFGISLARFDYMAQLHRYPAGLSMRLLGQYLMVTGGNVTGLTNELVKESWVERLPDPDDRRSVRVRLTPLGVQTFEQIATVHEAWVVSLFAGLRVQDRKLLTELLGSVRQQVAALTTEYDAAADD
ncbi:MarR family winged helix-turn-helix transcriptional regulator [Ideonella sp. B508-1]|uniref:MarR family winged helix-turn-helix transcriptional regulator n=1 Tax=Ideonella sp. B508-1 TaxID=137716 RepID=UPI000348E8B7|nr:MarR family transcriptional regulator [Ideonella sp. B508-1]